MKMFGQNLKKALFAAAATGAMVMGMGISTASADPFTINPNAIPGIVGYAPVAGITDLSGSSNALVRVTGATTQTETGIVRLQNFIQGPNILDFTTTGLFTSAVADTYGIYIKFTANVTGVSGFGGNNVGSIGPGGFTFTMYADIGDNDTFVGATANGTGGIAPSITSGAGNDIVLATGSSLSGSAGFQGDTGAPIFSATSTFVLCDGTAGQGKQGGTTVAATDCGTFNAASYFTAPNPFYAFDFASTTTGSAANNLIVDPSGNASLNAIGTVINFTSVPEPSTLLLFGSGLLALGAFARRRKVAG
jgi:hypothetical protein